MKKISNWSIDVPMEFRKYARKEAKKQKVFIGDYVSNLIKRGNQLDALVNDDLKVLSEINQRLSGIEHALSVIYSNSTSEKTKKGWLW